jgi:hypothetical protein
VPVPGNGDIEIIVLKVQGKQLGNVVLVFNNKNPALPDRADVNSYLSSCRISRLAGFICLPESRPEISRNYHGGLTN